MEYKIRWLLLGTLLILGVEIFAIPGLRQLFFISFAVIALAWIIGELLATGRKETTFFRKKEDTK